MMSGRWLHWARSDNIPIDFEVSLTSPLRHPLWYSSCFDLEQLEYVQMRGTDNGLPVCYGNTSYDSKALHSVFVSNDTRYCGYWL